MPGPNTSSLSLRRRRQCERPHQQPRTTQCPTRMSSSSQLMAQGSGLVIPQLNAIPVVHKLIADDRQAVMLAKVLVELDIATPGDWKRADHDPTTFIRLTLERWIKLHGGSAIRDRFLLSAVISNSPLDWTQREGAKPSQLFLIIEPSEATCGCVSFGPTLKLLESIHSQLPATFFQFFVGALNRWIRIYDYRDAQERAETLREWAAQEPDADQYEIPDVAASILPCMGQEELNEGDLACLMDKINDPIAVNLLNAVLALDNVSKQAERPELDENIREELPDCNPPLPCLVAVFVDGDAVSASFDEEAQGMMEVEPEPNIIIPFDPSNTHSVQRAFHIFGVTCQTIAQASGLIDLMPGNDQWIISR